LFRNVRISECVNRYARAALGRGWAAAAIDKNAARFDKLAPTALPPYAPEAMAYRAIFGRSSRVLGVAVAFASSALFGCGGSDQLKKQVASLETQLTSVRADQDRLEERLAAVELASSVPPRTAPASQGQERVEHPRLKVIHLAPEDESSSASEPSDESSANPTKGQPSRRPIIRGTGDRVIKAFDADGDESTKNDDATAAPVAELRREPHRN
jgi:hypothetical protein